MTEETPTSLLEANVAAVDRRDKASDKSAALFTPILVYINAQVRRQHLRTGIY